MLSIRSVRKSFCNCSAGISSECCSVFPEVRRLFLSPGSVSPHVWPGPQQHTCVIICINLGNQAGRLKRCYVLQQDYGGPQSLRTLLPQSREHETFGGLDLEKPYL